MAPIQPNASVVATGLGIRYIGDHCYAYNEVELNNSTATQLEFTSGSGYIVATYNCTFDLGNATANKMLGFHISFNDQEILTQMSYFSSVGGGVHDLDNNWPLLIPPFTLVKIEAQTQIVGSVPSWASLTGRVYGAE